MKKTLAVLLCLVMLVAVCACTPTEETSKATSDVVSTESDVSAEESTETTIKYSANVPEGLQVGRRAVYHQKYLGRSFQSQIHRVRIRC